MMSGDDVARVIPIRPEPERGGPPGSPVRKPRTLSREEKEQGHTCGWVSTCKRAAVMWYPEDPGSEEETPVCKRHIGCVESVRELRRLVAEVASLESEVDKRNRKIGKVLAREHRRPDGLPVSEMARLLGVDTRNTVYRMMGRDF